MEKLNQKYSWKQIAAWVLTIGLPIMILMIPENEYLNGQMKIYLAISIGAIVTFVFENINMTAVSVLLPFLYIIFAKVPAPSALGAWLSPIPWFMLGGMLLAAVLERIGLLKRIAYKIVLSLGATYKGIIWGMGIAGLILYLFLPGNTVVPMAALAYGVCKALGLTQGKASAGITLSAGVAAIVPHFFIYNSDFATIEGLITGLTGPLNVSYIQYIFENLAAVPMYFLLLYLITVIFKPEVTLNSKKYFENEYQKMGSMSQDEKKAIGVCLILLILVLTTNIHHVSAMYCFTIVPIMLYFPFVNVAEPDDFKRINYPLLLFVAACLSIGNSATGVGMGELLEKIFTPIVQGQSIMTVFLGTYVGATLMNFLMTPMAIMAAFSMPLTQIFMVIGVEPTAFVYFFIHSLSAIVLPYEVALWLIFYSFGMISMRDFTKYMIVISVVDFVWVFAIMLPYWKLVGCLML